MVAHAGHWLVDLAFALPLVIIAVAILVSLARGRRQDDASAEDQAEDPPSGHRHAAQPAASDRDERHPGP